MEVKSREAEGCKERKGVRKNNVVQLRRTERWSEDFGVEKDM